VRQPDARDAAWILVLALLAMLGVRLLAVVGLPQVLAGALQQSAFFGAPLLYARWAGLNPFGASGFVPLGLRRSALVLLASLGSLWLMYGLSRVETDLIRIAGFATQARAEEQQLEHSLETARDQNPIPAVVALVLLAPLCEETFFRGILFRGLAARFGLGIALAGTSFLFSAAHSTLVQKGMTIFLGAYFAVLVHVSGSLWAGILAHGFNNLAVVLLTWTFGTELRDLPAPWWMLVLSAVVFGLALTGLALERRLSPAAGRDPAL
jgi:membrane protease YdiL (CAAX protease family)